MGEGLIELIFKSDRDLIGLILAVLGIGVKNLRGLTLVSSS